MSIQFFTSFKGVVSIAVGLLLGTGLSPAFAGKGISHNEAKAVEQSWLEMRSDLRERDVIDVPYMQCFKKASEAHGVPLPLLIAVARGESAFEAGAVSSAGAVGVMQILWPGTANELGIHKRRQLFKPCVNIHAGARYLKKMNRRYQGDWYRTLAAYNYGPGRIRKAGEIPSGAAWYSGYILNHFRYVTRVDQADHSGEDGSLLLASFSQPVRTQAVVAYLRQVTPDARVDWFKRDKDQFDVVLLYRNGRERKNACLALSQSGVLCQGVRAL